MKRILIALSLLPLLTGMQAYDFSKAKKEWTCGGESQVQPARTGKQWLKQLAKTPNARMWRIALCNYADDYHEGKQLTATQGADISRLRHVAGVLNNRSDVSRALQRAQDALDFGLTMAIYDKAVAEGTVKPADDLYIRELYYTAKRMAVDDKKELQSYEAEMRAAKNGKGLLIVSRAQLGYGNYSKAISLAREAIAFGVANVAAAQLQLGTSLALSGDAKSALAELKKVKGAGREKEIADFWSLYLKKGVSAK